MSLYIRTLDQMKGELGISSDDSDTELTAWLEGLQGRFDTHCRRIFLEQTSRVEIHDGGYSSLFVEAWPIESVSEILIDSDQDWSDPDNTLDSDDYLVANKRGMILYSRGNYRWPRGRLSIRTTYTGGLIASDGTAANSYVEYGHRQTLIRAFIMQAGFEWRNRETLGIMQISASGMAKQVGAGVALALKGVTLMPEVQTALQPLVRTL